MHLLLGKLPLRIGVLLVGLSLGSSASAATIIWDGGGANDNWSTALNWSTDTVPTSADDVLFDNTTFDTAVIDSAFGGSIRSLTLSSSFTGSVKLARNLIITGDVSLAGGTVDMRGSGYTLKVNGSWINTDTTFRAGTGTILLAGTGSHTFTETNALHNLTLNDGLVGYWKFDEGAGAMAYDSSGRGNHATLEGGMSGTGWAALSDNESPTTFQNTHALFFDGVNDFVSIPVGAFLTSRDYTVSMWFQIPYDCVPGSCSRSAALLGYDSSVGYDNLDCRLLATSVLYCYYSGSSGQMESVTRSWSSGTWYHFAVTFNAETGAKMFINGNLEASHSHTSRGVRSNFFYIGRIWWSATTFQGLIDDVRTYDRDLSTSEIAEMAAGNQPNSALGTYTLGSALDINGDFTLSAGQLDVSSSNYGITLAGNWENDGGVFTARSGTVTMDGTNSILFGGESSFATLSLAQKDPSLVGHWKMDEGDGTVVNDSSGQGNHAMFTGGMGNANWIDAPPGMHFLNPSALQFDGVDDRIRVEDFNWRSDDHEISVSLWAKLDSGVSGRVATLFSVDNGIREDLNRFSLTHWNSNQLLWNYGHLNWQLVSPDFTSYYDQWVHIALTSDGANPVSLLTNGRSEIFINGNSFAVKTNGSDGPNVVLADLSIGGGMLVANTFMQGSIDDLRIYDRVISSAEVSRLASGYASPSPVTLGADLVVSSSLTLDSSSWLDLTTRTLTATTASITNLGTIDEGTGRIIHSSSLSAPATLTAGATMTLTVTDSDENIDGSVPDTLTVTIDNETVTLTETGNATGIFTGTISSHAATPDRTGDGIISRDDACAYSVTVSYADTEDPTDTATASVYVTDPLTPCPPPPGGGRGSLSPGRGGTAPLIDSTTRRLLPDQPSTVSPLYGTSDTPSSPRSPMLQRLATRIEQRIALYPRLRPLLLKVLERAERRFMNRMGN